jgi:hypothetical protein
MSPLNATALLLTTALLVPERAVPQIVVFGWRESGCAMERCGSRKITNPREDSS